MSGAGTEGTLLLCLWQGEQGLLQDPGCPSKVLLPLTLFLLHQGDRGAPGELGETGEKVRWCQSRPALAWCP